MAAVTAYSRCVVSLLDPAQENLANQWLDSRTGSHALVTQLHSQIYPKSRTRYRFAENVEEAAAKAVFEAAFRRAPEQVIAAAETAAETSCYPLWKRVIRIYIPQVIGTIAGNTIVKISLVVATAYFGSMAGYQAYEATQHFVAAQAVPYIINNTPIEVIRVFNTAVGYLSWAYENWVSALFYTWVAQQVILLGPEVPYFTAAVRTISIWNLYRILTASPQTVGWFLWYTFTDAVKFVWNGCDDVSEFFLHAAEKADSERLVLSKQRAYTLWVRDTAPRQLV